MSLIERLVDMRLSDPLGFAARIAGRQASTWRPEEPLMVIAADHPARGALRAGADPNAMGDREELLSRCVRALSRPGVNGFLGTCELVADLANLGALDGKVVFGSMNRGGFAGACFELDDRMTGYDAQGIETDNLAGGKMLLRYDLSDPATLATVEAVAQTVTQLGRSRRIALVEPFMASRDAEGRVVNDLSVEAVVKSVAMTAGLGASSAWTWLKLPAVEPMEAVARASSMPILLLGGEVPDDAERTRRLWAQALKPASVRGLVMGRALLYPEGGDVETAVDEAIKLLKRSE